MYVEQEEATASEAEAEHNLLRTPIKKEGDDISATFLDFENRRWDTTTVNFPSFLVTTHKCWLTSSLADAVLVEAASAAVVVKYPRGLSISL